jgi:hypothetical protein
MGRRVLPVYAGARPGYTPGMADLTSFPDKLDSEKRQCIAIIETPKNKRNKFDYDPESNLFPSISASFLLPWARMATRST